MLTQIRDNCVKFGQCIISLQFHCTLYLRQIVGNDDKNVGMNDFLCIEQPINVPGFFSFYK